MRYLLSDIATICDGRLLGPDREVTRVITDSRSFAASGTGPTDDSDALFVAIRTPHRDGAAFVGELYSRGVRAFVVRPDFDNSPYPEAGFVVVDEPITALQALAAHYRSGFTGKVVGITGSHGKTVVKEWIAQLAPSTVSLFRSPKSWNSQIGVPLSLLMARGDEDYIVIEAGISKPGEMTVLQRIIRPDIAILTAMGEAHLENFVSPEQLKAEKMQLFRDCPSAILHGDPKIDDFIKRNTALAVSFWQQEGYDVPQAIIETLEPVAMRLEVKEGLHNSVIINDTYNSDLNSLAIALDYLNRIAAGRPRMVIMPENADATKLIKSSGIEYYVSIGPNFTVDDFLRDLRPAELEGRVILIKGGARLHFDRLSHTLERRSHTTVLEVDLDAILHNLRLCRSRLSPGIGVMPMIKAGAYGHGALEIARTLQAQGADYLAVAFADEGVALREAGITVPIVVLNADEGSFEAMIRHRLEPEIYNFVSLNEFTSLLKRHGEHHYPIHLKLDTGMHRLGFRSEHRQRDSQDSITPVTSRLVAELAAVERWARVATIFSHLAVSDDPSQDEFTRRQIADFDRFSSTIATSLPYPVRRHIANTAAIERFPEAQFDLVRLGLGLYGFGMDGAKPAATLKTRIVNITHLESGETVGYGRCGVLTRPSIVATIPMGYADGLDRHLSLGKWSVLVKSATGELLPAPIVGKVCMDSSMIDITDIENVMEGDEVIIFSSLPSNTIADMATVLDTIPYEVMTSISSRVKRIYTKE